LSGEMVNISVKPGFQHYVAVMPQP